MKKLILTLLACLLLAGMAYADNSVTFKWDKNTETDLAGYRLYQSPTPDGQVVGVDIPIDIAPEAGLYDHGIVPDLEPTKDAYTLTSVPDGVWYWILTAYDTQGNESGKSNEVSATLDSIPPGVPTILEIIGVVKAP